MLFEKKNGENLKSYIQDPRSILNNIVDSIERNKKLLDLFRQLVYGKMFFHDTRIIHCDIKHLNFMIEDNKPQQELKAYVIELGSKISSGGL